MSGGPRQSHELDEEGGSLGRLVADENAARGSLGGAAGPGLALPPRILGAPAKTRQRFCGVGSQQILLPGALSLAFNLSASRC